MTLPSFYFGGSAVWEDLFVTSCLSIDLLEFKVSACQCNTSKLKMIWDLSWHGSPDGAFIVVPDETKEVIGP